MEVGQLQGAVAAALVEEVAQGCVSAGELLVHARCRPSIVGWVTCKQVAHPATLSGGGEAAVGYQVLREGAGAGGRRGR